MPTCCLRRSQCSQRLLLQLPCLQAQPAQALPAKQAACVPCAAGHAAAGAEPGWAAGRGSSRGAAEAAGAAAGSGVACLQGSCMGQWQLCIVAEVFTVRLVWCVKSAPVNCIVSSAMGCVAVMLLLKMIMALRLCSRCAGAAAQRWAAACWQPEGGSQQPWRGYSSSSSSCGWKHRCVVRALR